MKVGFTYDAVIIDKASERVSFQEETMRTLGVSVNPVVDGKYHRFALPNSRKLNGWYVLSTDEYGTTFGSYGDWSSANMKKIRFCSKKLLSESELIAQNINMKQLEDEHDAEEKAQKEWLVDTWPDLPKAENHPYLERKGVGIHCDMRVMGDALCIPMLDRNGNLTSMQRILPDGKKLFTKNISTKGVRLVIEGDRRTFLCEGYATGASIHEATGATVIVCFSAGNMVSVSAEYPGATVVADNDASKTGEESAKKTGLKYILIPEEGYDANDYAQKYGKDALRTLLVPEVAESWSVPLNSWLDQPAPLSWLIKGWIPRNATITCFGASGSGKTFIVLDMMLSITTGLPSWHGAKVHKGNVFYMCGEGYAGMRGRAKAWALEHGISDLGNINITQSAKDLINQNDLQSATDEIDSLGWKPDLIVVDTLNRFYSGDENAADNIHIFLDSIQTLQRKYQCTILIVHHTGVAQEAQTRGRGSSALRAAMDVEFSVDKSEENTVLVTQRKQKDIEFLDPIGFRLKTIDLGWTDEDGEPVTSAVPEWVRKTNEERQEEVTTYMALNTFLSTWEGEGCRAIHLGWEVSKNVMKKFAEFWIEENNEDISVDYAVAKNSKMLAQLEGSVEIGGNDNHRGKYWVSRMEGNIRGMHSEGNAEST